MSTTVCPYISVVVPVYHAQHSIRELFSRLLATFNDLGLSFEIIFVDDASKDLSWFVVCELAAQDSRVRGIRLRRNFGQHNALLAGIRAAQGVLTVTLDDDLQHPPEEIPKLLNKIFEGFDVVYGSPLEERHGFFRDIASKLTKITLEKSMGIEVAQNISAFRLFKTDIRNAFKEFSAPQLSIDVLLTWATSNFGSVKVGHERRKYGSSAYSLIKLVRHAISMLTGFSVAPLMLAGVIGIFFAFFGVAVFCFVIFQYFVNGISVPGFAFLASIIAIFSGAQLLAMGIIGEYLAAVHQRTMGKPPYSCAEYVGERFAMPLPKVDL